MTGAWRGIKGGNGNAEYGNQGTRMTLEQRGNERRDKVGETMTKAGKDDEGESGWRRRAARGG